MKRRFYGTRKEAEENNAFAKYATKM